MCAYMCMPVCKERLCRVLIYATRMLCIVGLSVCTPTNTDNFTHTVYFRGSTHPCTRTPSTRTPNMRTSIRHTHTRIHTYPHTHTYPYTYTFTHIHAHPYPPPLTHLPTYPLTHMPTCPHPQLPRRERARSPYATQQRRVQES